MSDPALFDQPASGSVAGTGASPSLSGFLIISSSTSRFLGRGAPAEPAPPCDPGCLISVALSVREQGTAPSCLSGTPDRFVSLLMLVPFLIQANADAKCSDAPGSTCDARQRRSRSPRHSLLHSARSLGSRRPRVRGLRNCYGECLGL